MNLKALAVHRRPQLEAAQQKLAEAGVEYLHTHNPDIAGNMRTKIGPLKFSPDGEALCAILLATAHADGEPTGDTAFPCELSSSATGYANIQALADPGTIRIHGWNPKVASVICNSFLLDGSPNPIDARAILASQEARANALGFEVKCAVEFEFGLFHADMDLMRAGRYREMKPWGYSLVNYDILHTGDYQKFVEALMTRLKSLGIVLPAVTTEYGYGMYEIALPPKGALEAADDAARTKLAVRELAAEWGLAATFMARFQPPGKESACGAHHHISLWRDDTNVFAGEDREISAIGRRFLGGLLSRMRESHLFFRPTVNSYRRMDRDAWSPEDVSWGYENRMAAIRAITTPTAGAARFEHRVPGADINPYLTMTAVLAAGLDGLEEDIAPIPLTPGAPDPALHERLPHSLAESIAVFRDSAFIERIYGAQFQRHYTSSRAFEIEAFEKWMASHITDFEWRRYFIGT